MDSKVILSRHARAKKQAQLKKEPEFPASDELHRSVDNDIEDCSTVDSKKGILLYIIICEDKSKYDN